MSEWIRRAATIEMSMAKKTKAKSRTAAEKRAYEQLQRHLETPVRLRDIRWEYRLGVLVGTLCPRGNRAYGKNVIRSLVEELGVDPGIDNHFWCARKLADAIDEDELLELDERAIANRFVLSVSHGLALVTLKDEEQRRELADRCIAEKWSVRELRNEIHARQGKIAGGGAPLGQMKSRSESLEDFVNFTSGWISRYRQRWFDGSKTSISANLTKTELRKHEEQLVEAEELLKQMQRLAKSGQGKLRERLEAKTLKKAKGARRKKSRKKE